MKTNIIGADGIFPCLLPGLVDCRLANILIPRADGAPDSRVDIVITNVNSVERHEALAIQYPNAVIALFRPEGGHRVISAQHKGPLWQAVAGIYHAKLAASAVVA